MLRQHALLLAPSLLAGCSLVFSPGSHMGGGTDGGGAMDAGTDAGAGFDGGPDFDAGPGLDAGSDAAVPDGGYDGGLESLDPAEFCERGAEEYCAALSRCCSMPVDVPACLAASEGMCDALLTAALDRPYFAWDPAAAWAAVEEGRTLAATCEIAVVNYYVRREGYYAGLVGTRVNGESCDPASADMTEIGLAILSCEPGHTCVDEAGAPAEWHCRPLGAAGAPCVAALQCAGEAPRCVSALGGGPGGECGFGEDVRAICASDDECLSLSCEPESIFLSRCGAIQTQDEVYCPAMTDAP